MTDTDLDFSGGLFGDLDIANVSDNPFEIAPGTYRATCTDAHVKKNEETDALSLVIKWTIDEPGDEYHGMPATEYFGIPPRGVAYEDLEPKQKTALKFFKRRLREGFDLSESEMQTINPSELVGRDAYITIKHSEGEDKKTGEARTYMNIQTALCPRLYHERNEAKAVADKGAFGL